MARDFSENRKIKPAPIEVKRSSEVLESVNEIFRQEKIFVYGEGKAEQRYFTRLDKNLNSSRVKIYAKNTGGSDCYRITKVAKEMFESELEKDEDLQDCIKYVVFDCDDNFERIDNLTKKPKSCLAKEFCDCEKFKIVFSNMCFEVWILCHYNNPKERYSKENLFDRDFLKRECAVLTGSKKYPYEKLLPLEETAIKNSKKLIELHKSLGIEIYSTESNPVTQIGELVEELRKYER